MALPGPRGAAVMEAVLKEMGVEHYDRSVVYQMLEFSYSECTCIHVRHVVCEAWTRLHTTNSV